MFTCCHGTQENKLLTVTKSKRKEPFLLFLRR